MAAIEIFISHISEEAALAAALKEHLKATFPNQVDVFVSSDRKTIEAGSEWLQEVKLGLRRAAIVLVMCSQRSIARPWVNFEAGSGWINGKPLVPVCHSGMSPAELPVPLLMLNAITAGERAGLQKLHDVIRDELGTGPDPDAELDSFITEFSGLENAYLADQDREGRLGAPSVLCAATKQYAESGYGFERDVALLTRYFGDRVHVHRDLSSAVLRDLLREGRYDIVHLVMYVDKRTGDLVFDPLGPGGATASTLDVLSPRGLANQLRRAETKLVFLATCEALFLAVDVARVANMIASNVEIGADDVERWADCFYSYLADGVPLFEAADAAIEQADNVPLRLIPHQDFALVPS